MAGLRGALPLLAAVFAAMSSPAGAADYPSGPIQLHIGSSTSGSTDAIGRVLARSLANELDQPVTVHNTPGAGGAVMATQLLRAPPDGYMLGLTISHAYTGNPVVMPEATRYRYSDFTHLASVSKGQCALVTSADQPYESFDDLIDAARRGERPVFASQSPLTRILVDYIAGVADVQFRVITVQGGGEIMQAVLGRHADFGFSGGPHIDLVAAGRMRVLASAEEERLLTSPEVPTLRELGFDVSSCALFVVSAPPGLPEDIKSTLSTALERAIASPEVTGLIRTLRYPEFYRGPDEVTLALATEASAIERAVARIEAGRTGNERLSSMFMPVVAAALLLISAIALAGRRLTASNGLSATAEPGAFNWAYIGLVSVVIAVSFALLATVGYLAGAAAIVAGFMLLARTSLRLALVNAVAIPLALWLLFSRLLGFPLP